MVSMDSVRKSSNALTVRDLHSQPLCKPDDLGKPIPDSPHAVSVSILSLVRAAEGPQHVTQASAAAALASAAAALASAAAAFARVETRMRLDW